MSIQKFPRGRRRTRSLAVIGGVLAAEALWCLAELAFGLHVQAPAGNGSPQAMEIGPVMVGIVALVLPLIGWGALAVLERFTARARNVWLVAALLALAASLGMPLGGSGVPGADRAVLVLLHLVVAAVAIPVLYRTSPQAARRDARSVTRTPIGAAA
jgi:hypothetical protein